MLRIRLVASFGSTARRRFCSEKESSLTVAIALSVYKGAGSKSASLFHLPHRFVLFGPASKASLLASSSEPKFNHVYGNSCVPVYSPDPGYLIYIIESSGGDLANSLVISDVPADLIMARAAGVPSLALGKSDNEALLKCHPDLFISSVEEIDEAIVKLKDSSTY
jgi:hypothetical protein